jgi:transposase
MPQPIHHDQDDNAAGEVVLGVDTHKDLHAAAVINPLGVLLSSEMFPATAAGYRALLAWAGRFGTVRRAGVECTGSYGAALARHLRAAGVKVIEVNQPEGHPPSPGQDRHPRRRSCRPRSIERPSQWQREGR